MHSRLVRILAIVFLTPLLVLASEPALKRKIRLTHYGYPGDPNASRLTRLRLGDQNNILNKDSVAVSPDLSDIFPYDSEVIVSGVFIGFRHDTTNPRWRATIAIYDPDGLMKEDKEGYVEIARKTK